MFAQSPLAKVAGRTGRSLPALLSVVSIIVFSLAAPQGYSDNFKNLTKSENEKIASGQSVFRQIKNWKDLCIPDTAPFAKNIADEVKSANPNYIGEVIRKIPKSMGNSNISVELVKRLSDIKGYERILYWSKRNKENYRLFEKVRIIEREDTPTGGRIVAEQYMEPFGLYKAEYRWQSTENIVTFSSVNVTPLSYRNMKAIDPGNLVWKLEVYESDGEWFFYGIGMVKAFDLFGLLRDRLSVSFMGRIEAFYSSLFGEGDRVIDE
ncbi:MAG: DUF6675 family protein [Rectinemataceae bacterium]